MDLQAMTDERRARQMLEEQVRVIIQVCKKLNQDIEVKNHIKNREIQKLMNLNFL